MFPGPVFESELRVASRRFRSYAARSACGGLLLLILWLGYRALPQTEVVSVSVMSTFARMMFITLSVAQGVVVLAITPALVAPAIAGERSRKSLDDLLASDLTAAEIVLGKLGARLVIILALFATGLPILSLQTLIGGVEPREVLAACAAGMSTAVFLGGLSILASVVFRGSLGAVYASYMVSVFWLSLGPILDDVIRGSSAPVALAIEPAIRLLNMVNPLMSPMQGWGETIRMAAFQTVAGIALAGLAILCLRPSALGLGDPLRRRSGRLRLLPRKAVGDDPMRWKETQVRRPAGLMGNVVRVILFFVFVGLALLTIRAGEESFQETWRHGYSADGSWVRHIHFNEFVRSIGTALYILALVTVTATAAGSITTEREADTWLSLIASPLTPEEILKAKRLGVYRRTWPFIAAVVAIWTVGLVSGAVHLLGFLAAIVVLPAYLASATALGLFISLNWRSTSRAIGAALFFTLVFHGGYLLLCAPASPETPVVAFGCSPLFINLAPISPGDLRDLGSFFSSNSFYKRGGEVLFAGFLSFLAYTVLTIALNILSAVTFDAAVDRPKRPSPKR